MGDFHGLAPTLIAHNGSELPFGSSIQDSTSPHILYTHYVGVVIRYTISVYLRYSHPSISLRVLFETGNRLYLHFYRKKSVLPFRMDTLIVGFHWRAERSPVFSQRVEYLIPSYLIPILDNVKCF